MKKVSDAKRLLPCHQGVTENRWPFRLLVISLFLSGLILAWLVWSNYGLYRDSTIFETETLRVSQLRGTIIHLDEVLTDSARMAAITGDAQWEERYRNYEPQLDQAIQDARRFYHSQPSSEAIAETDAANIKLVELEHRSLALVREGHPGDAVAILFSEEYVAQKKTYSEGMTKLFVGVGTSLAVAHARHSKQMLVSFIAGMVALALSAFFWLAVLRSLRRSRAALSESLAEERQAKENLQRSLKDLSEIKFALDESCIVAVTDQTGRITYVNDNFCRISKYSRDELVGQDHRIINSGHHSKEFFRDLWSTIATGKVWTGEICNRAKDGASFWMSTTIVPFLDEEGKPYQYTAIRSDITDRKITEEALLSAREELEERVQRRTAALGAANAELTLEIFERKRTEEAVKASEAKFKAIFDDAPVAYHELDREGRITRINRTEQRLLGYAATEMEGRLAWEFIVEKGSREAVEKKLSGGILSQSYERTFIKKDGTLIPVIVDDRLIYDAAGNVTGMRTTLHDITRQKQMEDELRKARDVAVESGRLKSEFLANMSHEIRNPMNGVIGMTGLLLDTDLNEDQRDFAETIRASGEALLTIINDILDFSKIDAGKLHFEILNFQLDNAVEDTIELFTERAHRKKIEFASLIYNDVPTGLRGDPGRLRQVLTNLIGNAIKFTERGEVTVRIEKESETNDDAVVRFTVSDTGIGISEAAQHSLFQAFTLADGSTTRKYGGTGLGLAISKQLVGLMGGRMGVNSTPGRGSTFWFTARFGKQLVVAAIPKPQLMSLENLRVLIVDDNPTNRKILSHQLGSWEVNHQEAVSGSRALEMLRAAVAEGAPYDLAILDLMMPVMDGFELARTIKSDPSIAGMHLVLLTSFGERGHGTAAREAGIAAYLTKPVRQSQLFDCLANVVSAAAVTPERHQGANSTLLTKHALKEAKVSSSKLILLAEDNIVNQKVAIRQLQKLGYRADAVANGREAIEALSRISYDLVLMDCQMPEMDGYEATAEIRRREGNGRHTCVVAMTAHALEGDRAKCIAAGMDDYVSKPVKPEQLDAVLTRMFSEAGKNGNGRLGPNGKHSPPVDMERLVQVMGDEPSKQADIIAVYLEEMVKNLVKLKAAIATGNAREINFIAHGCIGTSASCGMVAVVEPLRKMERRARENRLEDAGSLLTDIDREFDRVRLFLQQNLELVAA